MSLIHFSSCEKDRASTYMIRHEKCKSKIIGVRVTSFFLFDIHKEINGGESIFRYNRANKTTSIKFTTFGGVSSSLYRRRGVGGVSSSAIDRIEISMLYK